MTSWIVPCNLAYYDVAGAFANLPCVTWKQTRKVCVGDIVYIYVGKPISAIKYKAREHIDRLTKKGMPRYKVGIKVMFDLDEVKLWMKERGK